MIAARSSPAGRRAESFLDGGLFGRLRARETEAREELVRSLGPPMLGMARRLLGDEESARAVVRETFAEAFARLDSFEESTRFALWLRQKIARGALERLRERSGGETDGPIERLLPKFDDEEGHRIDPGYRWDVSASRLADARPLVRRKIQELPDSYRAVLVLRDVEGFGLQEASSLLSVPVAELAARLHRARQALRELLDPHFQEDPS